MAVYERGYRTYSGDFKGAPAWLVIFQEGYAQAFRSWGFRIIGLLFIVWFVIWGAGLYFTLGITDTTARMGGSARDSLPAAVQLKQMLSIFYGGISVLTGLLAILIGSGLISADLRARALPLYLVRPIHAWEYVLGKALILPKVLLWTCLFPGCFYYLLVGMWQPPGETLTWLGDNFDILSSIVWNYLIAATSYTGLMLFLSARTDRGGAVTSVAAAVLFAGSLLYAIMSRLEGVGGFMKYAGIPVNTVSAIARNAVSAPRASGREINPEHVERILDYIPEPSVALMVGVGLLILGIWGALRRARTVEISA
jgi:ABC-type transport system involved in multi-copper enzyme maturation permease subunit